MWRSIDVESQILVPVVLLKLIDDLTSPTTVSGEDVVDYNRFYPIADQAVRRDMVIVTDPSRILTRTERFRAPGALQVGVSVIGEIVPDRVDLLKSEAPQVGQEGVSTLRYSGMRYQ